MYASVVYFNHCGEAVGRIVSDNRPLKSARKYVLGDQAVVLRVSEVDDGIMLKVTKGSLSGEVMHEGVVPDGRYTRINDGFGSFWVVVVSTQEFDVDITNQGVWTDEYGRLRKSDICGNYEDEPEHGLSELLPPPERETPAFREATEIDGRDVRYLSCGDGGFFEGDSNLEAWYVPAEDCYKVRFWHCHGSALPRRKASLINIPERVTIDEMSKLICTLQDLGLADTYSAYRNKDILDGGGWNLEIGTRDGYSWSWGGYNAYPSGWDAARDAVCELLLGYPKYTAYDGHTAFVVEYHGTDGDWGRTDIAHLYRHGVELEDSPDWRIQPICMQIRQDLLLYRRTRRVGCECKQLDDDLFDEIIRDVESGLARRRTTGELMGAIAYIIDHDDAKQTTMIEFARNGILGKLLCNVRVRDKAAPGLAVTGRDV